MVIFMFLCQLAYLLVSSSLSFPVQSSLLVFDNELAANSPSELLHLYSFRDGFISDLYRGKLWDGFLVGGAHIIDGQLSFSSTESHVIFPHGLFSDRRSFSFETWMTTGSNIGSASIFRVVDSSIPMGELFIVERKQGTGTLQMSSFDASGLHCCGYRYNNTICTFDNQRNMHLVLTIVLGDFAQLFVNGNLVGRMSTFGFAKSTSLRLYLGSSLHSVAALNGSLDEFRVWDGVLTPAEIHRNNAIRTAKGT